MRKNKNLIYIAGPTGVGKTDLSIEIAKKFNAITIMDEKEESENIEYIHLPSLYDIKSFLKKNLSMG